MGITTVGGETAIRRIIAEKAIKRRANRPCQDSPAHQCRHAPLSAPVADVSRRAISATVFAVNDHRLTIGTALQRARLLLGLTVAALLGGCATGGPNVTVNDLRFTESTDQAALFDVAVSLANPTADELRLRETSYTVTLPDGRRYRGRRATESTLAPGDRIVIELPAVFADGNVSTDDIASVRIAGSLSYLRPGEFLQSLYFAGLYRPHVSFSATAERVDADR